MRLPERSGIQTIHHNTAKIATLVTAACMTMSGCSNERSDGGDCDRTGRQLAADSSFDNVREETIKELSPRGNSEVINANNDGVIINVSNANGKLVDQIVAYYVDEQDLWITNRYLSCPG